MIISLRKYRPDRPHRPDLILHISRRIHDSFRLETKRQKKDLGVPYVGSALLNEFTLH